MKKYILFSIIGLLAIFTAACGSSEGDAGAAANNGDSKNADKPETVNITHELGEAKVPKNPEKVAVFDYGALDTLDKLGVDVAGVAKGSNIPTYLDQYNSDDYENIGSLKEPDFEKLAQMDPDVILISGRQSAVYEELQKIAPTVYVGVDTANYMDSFKENMGKIGTIFNKQDKVDQALKKIDQSITDLQEKAEKADTNALIVLANDDKISAYGPNSRFGIIHDVFGIPAVDKNIEVSTHGMNVSFEYVVEQNPEMMYVIDRSAVVGGESSAKQLVENDLVKKTEAYKNDNIVYLNPEFWYLSGGGLESIQEMIKEVDKSLQ